MESNSIEIADTQSVSPCGVASAGLVLDEPAIWDPGVGLWHVIHTKPRQEKALVKSISGQGIHYFLPLVRQIRIYGHRRREVELPLFPGYVFLRGTVEETYCAMDTRRAVRVLSVTDQDGMDHDLHQIAMALRGEGVLDPYPYLREGVRVRVRSGPFCGLEGLVDAKKRGDRIILIVRTIGRATSLEIDASLLEVIDTGVIV